MGGLIQVGIKHMAHEKNRNGKYYCVSGASGTARLGSACDFRIIGLEGDRLVEWILEQQLPFDSLYYYGSDRPIHISYSPQLKRSTWVFTAKGVPTRRRIKDWIEQAKM